MVSISQKIVGGTYDFHRNILSLDVEITQKEGGASQSHTETREFDVTSLKVTRKSKDGSPHTSLEVLGARTEETMQRIMPQIIETFKQMESGAVASLLRNCSADSIGLRKTVKFEKALLNDVERARLAQEQGQPLTEMPQKVGMRISTTNQEIAQNDQANGIYEYQEVGHSVSTVSNPQVTQVLLKASNWESMIGDVAGNQDQPPLAPDHAWTVEPSKALKNSLQNLDQILHHFGQNQTLLNEACQHYHTHLQSQVAQITERIAQNEAQIKANNERVSAIAQEASAEESLVRRVTQGVEQLNSQLNGINQELAKRLYVIQVSLPNLHRELAILFSLKNLNEQKLINMGRAPMGSSITHEWDDIVAAYKLVPLAGKDLQEHLRKQLGFSLNAELSTPSQETVREASDHIFKVYQESLHRSADAAFSDTETETEGSADESDTSAASVSTSSTTRRTKRTSSALAAENARRQEQERAKALAEEAQRQFRRRVSARPALDLEFNLTQTEAESSGSEDDDFEVPSSPAAPAAFVRGSLHTTSSDSSEESEDEDLASALDAQRIEQQRRTLLRQQEGIAATAALLKGGTSEEEIRRNPLLAPYLDQALLLAAAK